MSKKEKKQMLEKKNYPGRCNFCGAVFGKRTMATHLKSCRAHEGEKSKKAIPALQLLIEGRHLPGYWLHVAIPIDFELQDLDRFLRDIWLECCGHLSMFIINGVEYTEDYEEIDYAESIEIPVGTVLRVGDKFHYDYDFGTTTRLSLQVIGPNTVPKKEIVLLARNEPPFIPCVVCGQNAELICRMCSHQEEGWLCSSCAKKHRCDEPSFLPVVNSPRTGQCGYTGAVD
jgi:hypothetical protein